MPFQFDIRRSSPSARPYEQASADNISKLDSCMFTTGMLTSTQALLSLLKLLQQTEVSRNLGTHDDSTSELWWCLFRPSILGILEAVVRSSEGEVVGGVGGVGSWEGQGCAAVSEGHQAYLSERGPAISLVSCDSRASTQTDTFRSVQIRPQATYILRMPRMKSWGLGCIQTS